LSGNNGGADPGKKSILFVRRGLLPPPTAFVCVYQCQAGNEN